MPSASYLGFLASFGSLTLSYLLTGIRPIFIESSNNELNYGIMILIFVMALRHQIRILSLDIIYLEHCDSNSTQAWRFEFWSMFVVSIMGGIILTLFFYGDNVVAAFMAVYCVLFLVFGISVVRKVYKFCQAELGESISEWSHYPKSFASVCLSMFADLLLLFIWILLLYYILTFSPTEQQPDKYIGIYFLAFITILMLVGEFWLAYKSAVIEQMKRAAQLLF